MPRHPVLCVLCLLIAANVHAGDAHAVFARAKAASGGPNWDTVTSWRGDGSASTGSMNGSFQIVVDARAGRSADHYAIGSVQGADGFDGAHAWQRDPGGEVAVLDAPAALRRARSQAWLDAHGYWHPTALPAQVGAPTTKTLDGKRYAVIVATPVGGDPITLWFDADSGLLARAQAPRGSSVATTVYSDYRVVDGVRVPFEMNVDVTDAAGRTDPRDHAQVRLDRVALNVAVADADFAVPAMTPGAHIDNPTGITTIPFDLVNNHIYVDGSVDGKPAHFLVDTGGTNLLTPAAAAKFGLRGEGKLAGRGVGDKAVDLSLAHARQVRVGDAVLDQPVFYVIDLGQLPQVEGVTADGLVGYEMFRRFGVEIDYAKHRLVLSDPAKFVPPQGAVAVPFELDERIPIVTGTLDGLPMRMSVDTGSRSSLTLHSPFVRAHDLIARYHAAPESVNGWGVGGAARSRPARFGTLTIGDVRIDGVAGDMTIGNTGGFTDPNLTGNLGGGVLKRFDVAFDYAHQTMYLKPNASADAPDVFDRSGLWLLTDGDALDVVDVAQNSAAQQAGMKVGDRIVSIGGKPVGAHTLADWRQILCVTPARTRLALDYLRGGKQQSVALVLADRIPATFTQ
ncbi:MAG: aspartyl protease family protein [Proteobacteria bacterium]|nr:aspartyl protease family protein [Pseudomonadota bacterium]MBS0463365.1 aspartyl protease family protein [Pseudomonadota bacterium]